MAQINLEHKGNENWLYLKVYCTPNMANPLLSDVFWPFISEKKKESIISKWFFTRYYDVAPHLRLRVKINDLKQLPLIYEGLSSLLFPLNENNRIGKYSKEKYHPEINRYGKSNIEVVEDIFEVQSEFALSLLHHGADERLRIKYCIDLIEHMFESLDLSVNDRRAIVSASLEYYKGPIVFNKSSKRKLGKEYRIINAIGVDESENSELSLLTTSLRRNLEGHYAKLTLGTLHHFGMKVTSLGHMLANKLFIHNHKEYEFLIYEFLERRLITNIKKRKAV
ncbi:MAG: thiopeptide-type bacteriocin biosynthesis protein [Bacteroidota bacterium]